MTNETLLRDALSEAGALITGLLARQEHEAFDLLQAAGGNIEAKVLAALRHVDTTRQSTEDTEGPECPGCANLPASPCSDCEYTYNSKQINNAGHAIRGYLANTLCCDSENHDRISLLDLLADLRHWAASKGVDFDDCDRTAGEHYRTEPAPVPVMPNPRVPELWRSHEPEICRYPDNPCDRPPP